MCESLTGNLRYTSTEQINRAKLIYNGPVYMSYYIKKYCSNTSVNHGWMENGIPLIWRIQA